VIHVLWIIGAASGKLEERDRLHPLTTRGEDLTTDRKGWNNGPQPVAPRALVDFTSDGHYSRGRPVASRRRWSMSAGRLTNRTVIPPYRFLPRGTKMANTPSSTFKTSMGTSVSGREETAIRGAAKPRV
jgi:hypothetical protein